MDPIALTCVAVLGLLLFGLGLAVAGLRFRERTLSFHATAAGSLLERLVRAHGNTAEHAPFLALLMLYLGLHQPSGLQQALMVAASVSRVLLVIGLLGWRDMSRPNPARFTGAVGTFVFGIALCIELLRGLA